MKTWTQAIVFAFFGLSIIGVVAAGQDPSLLPATPTDPYAAEAQQLRRALFESDNEVVRLRTELSSCHAIADSNELSHEANDLLLRCAAIYGAKCTWDDKQHVVVKPGPPKEPLK